MIDCEFPHQWPQLVNTVMSYVQSQDPPKILGALHSLLVVSQKYSHVSHSNPKIQEYYAVVQHTQPMLLKLFQYLCDQTSFETLEMKLLIAKIFHNSINYGVPPLLSSRDQFLPWIECFGKVLLSAVPEEGDPQNPREKALWPPWQLKKVVAGILERLFHRYGSTRRSDSASNVALSGLFMKECVASLTQATLTLLNSPLRERMPRLLLGSSLSFLHSGLTHAVTWKILKSNLSELTSSILFPSLRLTPYHMNLFENDQQAYVQEENDFSTSFKEPRGVVVSFLIDSILLRGNDCLDLYIDFVVNKVFQPYNSGQNQNPLDKDAGLVIIGILASFLKKSKKYSGDLSGLLQAHVWNEFDSKYLFLRSRAYWVFSNFRDVQYSNPQQFLSAVQNVVNSLGSDHLVVRVFAFIGLSQLVKHEAVQPLIEPIIGKILEAYFATLDIIDSDDLVAVVSVIIKKYAPKVQNMAPAILQKLISKFNELTSSDDIFNDYDNQTPIVASFQCTRAIINLLEAVKGSHQILHSLVPLLQPFLKSIRPALIDFYGDYLAILVQYSFYLTGPFDTRMWDALHTMMDYFFECAGDFAEDLVEPLDNFISKSTNEFLSNGMLSKVLRMYEMALKGNMASDVIAGCNVAELLLVYCKGKIDQFVPAMIAMATERLQNEQKKSDVKVALLSVVANALYYNPQLTLAFLTSKQWEKSLFGGWFELLPKFQSTHHLKVVIVAFSSMLRVPVDQWPSSLQSELPNFFTALISLIDKYQKRKELNEEEYEEESEEEEAGGGDMDEASYEGDSDSEDILSLITAVEKHQMGNAGGSTVYRDDEDVVGGVLGNRLAHFADDDSEEEFSDDEGEDDGQFESLIDKIDEVVFFVDSADALNRQGNVFTQLMNSVGGEKANQFQMIVGEANRRKANGSTNSQF
eukprot:TRINITY_DN5847_c0_g1_i1.p1 TRINITY_DN5847_c0_g1~~TRINITY_DN5847_c0_g1_i1.p1  ORF type:complete len:1046 (+),score=282.97 TRINITY_DN5847_c0_g1_i1:382-3138(+)